MDDAFENSPYNAESTEDWNRSACWQDYYRNLYKADEEWRYDMVVHRQTDLLLRMLTEAGELPPGSRQTVLDAGCGISLIPHVLGYWGFRVTAVDLSSLAIDAATRHRPDERDLARCIRVMIPCEEFPGTYEYSKDPAVSLKRLRNYGFPGGRVKYMLADWFSPDLPCSSFGIIYCRNALRCSVKRYWRRSLNRFRELLVPGGILLLENVNAYGMKDEVEALTEECDLVTLMPGKVRDSNLKYVASVWPTG